MGRTIAESKEIQDSAPVNESSDGPRGAAAMEGPEDNAVPAAETYTNTETTPQTSDNSESNDTERFHATLQNRRPTSTRKVLVGHRRTHGGVAVQR